jgi:outer membrane biosynthesis protein TonB
VLVAVIWGLVVLAAVFLALGFFVSSSNLLLILAIVFALAAIILVLGSWARRARDASTAVFDDTISFGEEEEGEPDDEDLYSALDTDTKEEFAVGGRRDRPARRPAPRKSGAKPAAKPKPKPKPKAKPKPKPTASKSTEGRKPAAAKPKAKPTSRPKAKPPPRRRPPTE